MQLIFTDQIEDWLLGLLLCYNKKTFITNYFNNFNLRRCEIPLYSRCHCVGLENSTILEDHKPCFGLFRRHVHPYSTGFIIQVNQISFSYKISQSDGCLRLCCSRVFRLIFATPAALLDETSVAI
jgi:hypothetical protein